MPSNMVPSFTWFPARGVEEEDQLVVDGLLHSYLDNTDESTFYRVYGH